MKTFGGMAKTPNLYVWEKVWQTVSKKEKHIYAGIHPGWTELIKEDNIISTASMAQRQQKRWGEYTSYESPIPSPPPSFCICISCLLDHSAVKCFASKFKFTAKGNKGSSDLFRYTANSWKQILRHSINKQEVKMEEEKMDVSSGRRMFLQAENSR